MPYYKHVQQQISSSHSINDVQRNAIDKSIKRIRYRQAKKRYNPNFTMTYPLVVVKKKYDRPTFKKVSTLNNPSVLKVKFKVTDYFSLFIFKLIFVILLVNFIGITDAAILDKKYIKPLDNSVVYYDVNINDGTITELSNVNNINGYTDTPGHIIQQVYNYDWFEKFKQLDSLKPVFDLDFINDNNYNDVNNPPNNSLLIDLSKNGDLGGDTTLISVLQESYKLLNNNVFAWTYSTNNGCWIIYNTSNDVSLNGFVKQTNQVLIHNNNTSDNFINKLFKLLAFPINILYNLGYDTVVLAKFAIWW